jgi:hypothetical protein
MWSDFVIPVTVEFIASELDLGEILIGNLDAGGIVFRV